MQLTKAFDWIHTAADKAYLAHCTCNGDVCQCSHDDGQPIHQLSASNNKQDFEMSSSFINRMSAAERTKLADTITAANEHMSIDERRDLVDALTVALGTDLKAKAAADKQHDILSRVHACELDVTNGGRAELVNANNVLRLAGVGATVQELAFKSVFEVDAIFAAATGKFDSTSRLAVKRVLDRRLGWGK
jgi:hypothetical protein